MGKLSKRSDLMSKKNYPNPNDVPAQTVLSTELTGAGVADVNTDYDPHLEKHLNHQMQKRKPNITR